LILRELNEWEKGRQWELSCFSAAKDALVDVSPDELRAAAYASKGDPQKEQVFVSSVRAATEELRNWRRKAIGNDPSLLRPMVSYSNCGNSGLGGESFSSHFGKIRMKISNSSLAHRHLGQAHCLASRAPTLDL
jgi:hypothetical protein